MTLALYLVTNDLRLDDSRALMEAARYDRLLIVYAMDPAWFSPNRYGVSSVGPHRRKFLNESLRDLDWQLRALNQRLFVIERSTLSTLKLLFSKYEVQTLITSRQSGWYEGAAISAFANQFPDANVQLVDNYTLFDHANDGSLGADLPMQFTPFRRHAERQRIPSPLPKPANLPPPPEQMLEQELGFIDQQGSETQVFFVGGETAAERHVTAYFESKAPLKYKETRNELSGWNNSTKWSSWLANGCISPRRIFSSIVEYEACNGANDSTEWLKLELLWREYFQWLARKIGSKLYSFRGLKKHSPLATFYPERFKRWCEGNTPQPLVNACMKELQNTGYMSNRGRQIVASYLVNELQLDWRFGAAWFEHHLIDYDVASNWGNWQYIAGVGVDPRGGRHFDIDKQQKTYDPDSQFIERWLGRNYNAELPTALDTVDAADWPITH